jgi:NAD(P)-dependent dehydrogenase (short-subunit alcohol dehydrogenase family)
MARIFITGSADGLGQLAAKTLIQQGHQVVLHARNGKRGDEALMSVSGAEGIVTGDLSFVEQTKKVAEEVNTLGTFDAIIHNAGVYRSTAKEIFSVNTIAPYILTCLIKKPERLIYLSSDMHLQGHFESRDLLNDHRNVTYSDSKLHIVMLCLAVARKWPQVYANAVNPGCLQRWAVEEHPMTWKKDMTRRFGWPQVTNHQPK